ncbi:MAG TPA: glycosyltransferase, partial [Flavisolibacter sp.]|nr:glycosyltransferase [Flavisolibacter sp.]
MKFLHVIGEFDIKAGGTYTALISLIKMFNELGHTNTIIATGKHSGKQGLDVDLFCFEKSFPVKFRKSKKGKQWLSENIDNYDAVIIHEIWGGIGLDACMIALKRGIPYHIWPHGSLDPFDLQKRKYLKKILGKLLVNKVLRNAKYICCTSEKEKQVINCFGKTANNIISVLLPIDFCLEKQIVQPRPSLIRSELPDDAFVFLFFSRINYKKGLDLFLRAFAECLAEKRIKLNSYFLIAGTGSPEYEKYIDDLIFELNLQSHVIKLGLVTG